MVNKNTSFKLFVAGGAGFIGSNFIRGILQQYPKAQVLNFDKLTYSGNPDNLSDVAKNKQYRFVRGDVADTQVISKAFRAFKPDYVINFAAETHVDRSIHVSSEEFLKTNLWGVFNLLELVKELGVTKYVQVSTDEVYGSLALDDKNIFTEKTPFAPNVPYAATKAGGDLLCRAYHSTWKVPVVVTHCSNNYGPYQYPEKLIPYFILRILEGKKLPLYGDGLNVRDWIYVKDHCEALELCLFNGVAGEVYNIGADNELRNIDIARIILKYFGKDESWLEYVPDRPGHDRRYGIDPAKITRELGWKSRTNFKKAIQETIEWYVVNKQWVERVRKKTGVFNAHIDLWEAHSIKSKAKK